MEKIEFNELGGIYTERKEELKRAKEVDLVTLPRDITGTNCFNCKWIRGKQKYHGYCSHPKVAQDVNNRMCCILWSRTGEYREFSGRDKRLD